MQRQAERFGARTQNAEVRSIDLKTNPKVVVTNEGTFYGKTIALATGANPRGWAYPMKRSSSGEALPTAQPATACFTRGRPLWSSAAEIRRLQTRCS